MRLQITLRLRKQKGGVTGAAGPASGPKRCSPEAPGAQIRFKCLNFLPRFARTARRCQWLLWLRVQVIFNQGSADLTRRPRAFGRFPELLNSLTQPAKCPISPALRAGGVTVWKATYIRIDCCILGQRVLCLLRSYCLSKLLCLCE